jgi:hypothetical protein
MTSRFNRAGEGSGCTRRVAALSTVSRGEERQTSNAPHGPPLVTHQPLHSASFGAVWSIYSQCYPMSGCCLAGLGWLPVVPLLAFVVIPLVLAGHWLVVR